MSITIASATYTGVANTKSADLVTGSYQFVGKGRVTLAAKSSAIAMNATVLVSGVALVNDQQISFYGTAGTLSVNDNIVCSQMTNGGRVEFYIRNAGSATPTVDFSLFWDPA